MSEVLASCRAESTMAPYRITVYSKRTEYLSGLYAGLFELGAAGEAELDFSPRRPSPAYDTIPTVLRIAVTVASRRLEICFDTADWRRIASPHDLATADVYFKRGYHAPYVAQLEPALRYKVAPMDLQYACSSRNESWSQSVRDGAARQIGSAGLHRTPLKALKHIVGLPARRWLKAMGAHPPLHPPMYIDEFEVSPDAPAQPKIYYRTRVYGPEDAPDNFRLGRMDEVNDLRANTVRALRAHFGARFIGGLRHSDYARRAYPDCLYPGDPGLYGHLALTKDCLVSVNTAGLHDSTSWKMAEYLAASRCIASERPFYDSASPLVEGKHYLPFSTPEECVAACERLLDDPGSARAMRVANFAYYAAHVRPDQVIGNCLRAAFERGVPGAQEEHAGGKLALEPARSA
jgi:hypothetical protein